MPMREQGLGEDDWQRENHSFGKLGVECGVLQSYTHSTSMVPCYVLELPNKLWVVRINISAGVQVYSAK